MSLGMSSAIRNDRASILIDAIEADASAAILELYSTPRPATGASVGSAVLLVTLTFSIDAAPVPAGGTITFNSITDGIAVAGGNVTWARIKDGAGLFVCDMEVGTTGSTTADLTFAITTIVSGATVSIAGGTITEGNI